LNIKNILLIYEYYYWANHRILTQTALVTNEQFIAPASFPFGGLRGTLVHIVEAEQSWLNRLKGLGDGPELIPEEYPTFKHLEERMQEGETTMRAFLAGLHDEDMNNQVRYILDDGPRDRILWRCLYHLANHGTQHRSETAAMLTDFGYSPGNLDFNTFLDETGTK